MSTNQTNVNSFNRARRDYHAVGKCIPKKDSSQLLLGKPVFTDDITPRDALVIKLLRSPYANAIVEDVKTDIALKVPGMVAVYTPGRMFRKSVFLSQARPFRSRHRTTD